MGYLTRYSLNITGELPASNNVELIKISKNKNLPDSIRKEAERQLEEPFDTVYQKLDEIANDKGLAQLEATNS